MTTPSILMMAVLQLAVDRTGNGGLFFPHGGARFFLGLLHVRTHPIIVKPLHSATSRRSGMVACQAQVSFIALDLLFKRNAQMIRSMSSALAIALIPGLVQAAGPPFVIGSASDVTRSTQLVIHITRACPEGEMIQVVAASLYGHGGFVTAVDSGGVNHYQNGGSKWGRGVIHGQFLATTSPGEPTNAGLSPPATITVTYGNGVFWKAAIAECVPGLETSSGSADNQAGVSRTQGDGASIDLTPSPNVKTRYERLFVATVLIGDAADHWTESAGYKTLMTLQNRHTLNLAYQIVHGVTPSPYLATNSAARQWSAANRSYKTPLKQP